VTVAAGSRLGPYEILAALGAGGMGEVYKARDTRLDRTVAIKILPDALAADPQFRERFDREARTISRLDHPHICALYDVGEQDGTSFLVMQYLEGETLEARLKKGTLPLDQALQYAIQIADALATAHKAGIVHRDLKPGNIMLTKAGAKLLDFGLAKAGAPVIGRVGLSMLPTTPPNLTVQGAILGTFQYMAPEQLEGQDADARTDIFAFGAVVYEMITGKKAFEGKSQASLISAIMSFEPPPISTLQPLTPPVLDRVVKTCLAKDPGDRWQAARDLMHELKWIAEAPVPSDARSPLVAGRKGQARAAWTATVVLFFTLFFIGVAYFRPGMEVRVQKFSVLPPEKVVMSSSGPNSASRLALSPDGRYLVFGGTSEGKGMLWIRALDSLSARPLAGTEGVRSPFWSPDSRFIGFFAQGKLMKIAVSGGPPQPLCPAPRGFGGTWNGEGVILFARDQGDGLYRVAAAGGIPLSATKVDRSSGELSHSYPTFLPDGRHFLYSTTGMDVENSWIKIGVLDSPESQPLVKVDSNAAYVSTSTGGYLVFARGETLLAESFDIRKLAISGEPVAVTEELVSHLRSAGSTASTAEFAASESGILAYRTSSGFGQSQLVWVDRMGRSVDVIPTLGGYDHVELSPNTKRVAVDRLDPQSGQVDIWLLDVSSGTPSRFTFSPGQFNHAHWSRDGGQLFFTGQRPRPGLYQKPSTGGTEALVYGSTDGIVSGADWSPDERFIVFRKILPGTQGSLWVSSLSGDREAKPVPQTEARGTNGRFSPDGRWLVYESSDFGRPEVSVQPFPTGIKTQISREGGVRPRWRPDEKELFYIASDRKLTAVPVVDAQGAFATGTPTALFEIPFEPSNVNSYPYDVSRDGQRFLVITPPQEAKETPITVVLNWTAALKK
jgi:serine/threonine protein kinase/Tol biopolymer transport system component